MHSGTGDLSAVTAKASRALAEFRIAGVASNREFLLDLLALPQIAAGQWHTGFIAEHLAALCAPRQKDAAAPAAKADALDPLAILSHGKRAFDNGASPDELPLPAGMQAIGAAISGTVLSIDVAIGDILRRGQQVAVMEAMKMEYVVVSPVAGVVREIRGAPDQTLVEGAALLTLDVIDDQTGMAASAQTVDLDHVRADLTELRQRRALTWTPRGQKRSKNVTSLGCAARARTSRTCAIRAAFTSTAHSPSLHSAVGVRWRTSLRARPPTAWSWASVRVNGALFADVDARCAVMSYDYTVLAGTQGHKNHQKKDRMFEVAAQWRLPLIIFAEGGGGRPGDTDHLTAGWLNIKAFTLLAKLSGLVPLVGVVSGRCFAGNAVVAGCCDVIIATEKTSLGMGGPAMIEGGGLGVFHPRRSRPNFGSAAQRRDRHRRQGRSRSRARGQTIPIVFSGYRQ